MKLVQEFSLDHRRLAPLCRAVLVNAAESMVAPVELLPVVEYAEFHGVGKRGKPLSRVSRKFTGAIKTNRFWPTNLQRYLQDYLWARDDDTDTNAFSLRQCCDWTGLHYERVRAMLMKMGEDRTRLVNRLRNKTLPEISTVNGIEVTPTRERVIVVPRVLLRRYRFPGGVGLR